MSARDTAEAFGLHPNVARNHLDVLAEAGLVVTGRRKQPSGGRPAKVYVAREQAVDGRPSEVPSGSQLAVATVVQLIAGLTEHEGKLELLAEDQGRRLVAAAGGRADRRPLAAAATVGVEALRRAFPEARIDELHDDHVHVAGLEVALRIVGEVDARVGDALARGFLRGAMSAAGAPTVVTSRNGKVRAELDDAGLGDHPSADASLDVRGHTYQAGVVAAVRALDPLQPGATWRSSPTSRAPRQPSRAGPTVRATASSTWHASATSAANGPCACCCGRPPHDRALPHRSPAAPNAIATDPSHRHPCGRRPPRVPRGARHG